MTNVKVKVNNIKKVNTNKLVEPIIAAAISEQLTPIEHIDVTEQLTPVEKTLKPIEIARANVTAKLNDGIGVTLHTDGKEIKGLDAEPLMIKPQRKMLRTISKIKGHPGKGNCVKRFHLYKEGMTLLDCKVTKGLTPSDVTFYAELGYLELREATDEEFNAAVKTWEDKHTSL